MHTQIKSIIIFPCSILTDDDPSCTILSSDSSVAHVLPPMSPVSEPTASIFSHTVVSCKCFFISCSPIDRPRPDTLDRH